MSSTRGAVASSSGRAKQLLVHLLFGTELRGRGRDAHSRLDPARYTYTDLRRAYLQRVHVLHPDRYQSHTADKRDEAKAKFVELQDAWSDYESFARNLKSSGDVDASFTLFGVGCSFSDNAEERALRAEITDQACRGWFSSGALPMDGFGDHRSTARARARGTTVQDQKATVSLVDDDLFVESHEEKVAINKCANDDDVSSNRKLPKRRSLVSFEILRK